MRNIIVEIYFKRNQKEGSAGSNGREQRREQQKTIFQIMVR